jgi:hypothetical protein
VLLDQHFVVDRAEGLIEDVPVSLKCLNLMGWQKHIVGSEVIPMIVP